MIEEIAKIANIARIAGMEKLEARRLLILHGIYTFKPRIVAYRNDFCLTCAAPRLAYQARSFDVIHLFYIPLIPIGFWKRWHCAVCNSDPHVHPGTRKGFKWVGVVVLLIFAIVVWAVPDDDGLTWTMRLALPLGAAAALWHTVRSKPDLRLKDKLREIQPADETACALCGGPLAIGTGWHCPRCGVERKVVKV